MLWPKSMDEVLSRIKPSKEEEAKVGTQVDSILKKINRRLSGAKAILGGSGIKGTWLRDAHDADIFVCYDYQKFKDRSDELSDILEKQLKRTFRMKRLHGSRDYFQIREGEFTYEIVPILKITKASQAKNITDVSPLHAAWVNRNKKARDDIRLLKQFCKGIGAYGAESYIKGISGYVCEILVNYYGSFEKVLTRAATWKEGTVIDVAKHHKSSNVFADLNKSKLESPLIVIDPVQADRNAAAALSMEKFEVFKRNAAAYIKKPSAKFFEVRHPSAEILRKNAKNHDVIILKACPLDGKRDTVGCKLLKVFEHIRSTLVVHEFEVLDAGWWWDGEATFYFIVAGKLPKMKTHGGPPVTTKEHAIIFKKKYKKTFIEKGHLQALIPRKYLAAQDLIKDILKDPNIKSRVKKIHVV